MRISDVAKAAEVSVETVRFYERKGLVEQPLRPTNGGYRAYPDTAVTRIRFIRQAQELGFSLGEVEELLSLKAEPDTDCSEVRNRALAKRNDVDLKIRRLRRIRQSLTKLIDACPGKGALEFCSILGAMEPHKGLEDSTKTATQKRKKGNS